LRRAFPSPEIAKAQPCPVRLIFIGFSLLKPSTNKRFSHNDFRFASTFLENCSQFLHNPLAKLGALILSRVVFLNEAVRTASESAVVLPGRTHQIIK
jgi:hypothetical protein